MTDAMDVTPLANEAVTDNTGKRKREGSVSDTVMANGTSAQSQTQLDILEILKRQDTQPSLLDHEFTSSASVPAQKKAKQSDPSDRTSIAENLRTGAYTSLVQLQQDAAQVSKELVGTIRMAEKQDGQTSRPSVEDLKRIQKITALERYIRDVADGQRKYDAAHARDVDGSSQQNGTLANGHAAIAPTPALKSGTVLTLFGNAPTPKQLFSSMQHPSGTNQQADIRLELPVEEMSLPNGLSATNIMQSGATENKPASTFEDTFAPPYSLPQLHPPKNHKRTSLRDNSVTWEFKDNVPRGTKRGGYTTASLNTGDWLGWGGIDPVPGTEAPGEKRKQRDRALSSNEAKPIPLTKAQLEAEAVQYEEALFRKCFSSFAPTSDNTKSLVPAATKDMVWFEKLGSRRFIETFGDDPALAEKPAPVIDPALLEMDAQDVDFGKMVEELDSLPEESFEEPVDDNTDADVVLRKISELLETLASHQRIRNSTLPGSNSISRTPISPAPMLASRVGKPDAPAEEEISTYNKLRRELAYLVLKLPPYMVAKLDGDQLADLGVGTLLPFETRDYKGSMEEDSVSRASKYSAAATVSSLAHLTRQTSSTSGQHYSSANSRTPAIGASANTRYGQTAGASRAPATAPAYQRSTSGQSTSYGTPSAAPRPTYGQQSQYTRPGAPQQSTYGQTNGQTSYYGQHRPQSGASSYGSYNQNYAQSTPQTQPRPAYSSSQPLQQFQQRSHAAAQKAVAYQTNNGPASQAFNRTASPVKPSLYGTPATSAGQTSQPQQRPSGYSNLTSQHTQYGQQPGSGRATPTFLSQPQTPVNGLPRPPPSLVPRAASGTPQPIAPQPAAPQNGNAYPNFYPIADAAGLSNSFDGAYPDISAAGTAPTHLPVDPALVFGFNAPQKDFGASGVLVPDTLDSALLAPPIPAVSASLYGPDTAIPSPATDTANAPLQLPTASPISRQYFLLPRSGGWDVPKLDEDAPLPPFVCNICGFRWKSRVSVIGHASRHSKEEKNALGGGRLWRQE